MKGDLHCHSRYSDGSETPRTIIKRAKSFGLDFISITDHDTMTVFDEIKDLEKEFDIKIIRGLEISAFDFKKNKKVHLLCYEPVNLDELKIHCERLRQARFSAGEFYIKSVARDFGIDPQEIMDYRKNCVTIYKQHVMEALISYGYATDLYKDLFKELFGRNGKYPVDEYYIDVYKAVQMIKNSGGVCVLAHPFEYDTIELMHELIEKKLIDGIEAYHSRCSEENQEYLADIARKNNLIITHGSDCHGRYNSLPTHIGCRVANEDTLNAILNFRNK